MVVSEEVIGRIEARYAGHPEDATMADIHSWAVAKTGEAAVEFSRLTSRNARYIGHGQPEELLAIAVAAEVDIAWREHPQQISDEQARVQGMLEYSNFIRDPNNCDVKADKVKLGPNGLSPVSEAYVEQYLDKID